MMTKADGWVSGHPRNDSVTGQLIEIETRPLCEDGYRHGPIVPVLPQSK